MTELSDRSPAAMPDEEVELRSLLSRVMQAPMAPLHESLATLHARLLKLEDGVAQGRAAANHAGEVVEQANTKLKRLATATDEQADAQAQQGAALQEAISALDRRHDALLGSLQEERAEAHAHQAQRGDALIARLTQVEAAVRDGHDATTASLATAMHTVGGSLSRSLIEWGEAQQAGFADRLQGAQGEIIAALGEQLRLQHQQVMRRLTALALAALIGAAGLTALAGYAIHLRVIPG